MAQTKVCSVANTPPFPLVRGAPRHSSSVRWRKPSSVSLVIRCAATAAAGGENKEEEGADDCVLLNWVHRNVRDPCVEVDPVTVRRSRNMMISTTTTMVAAEVVAPPPPPPAAIPSNIPAPHHHHRVRLPHLLLLVSSTLLASALFLSAVGIVRALLLSFSKAAFPPDPTQSKKKEKKKQRPFLESTIHPIRKSFMLTSAHNSHIIQSPRDRGDAAALPHMQQQQQLQEEEDFGSMDLLKYSMKRASSNPVTSTTSTSLPEDEDVTAEEIASEEILTHTSSSITERSKSTTHTQHQGCLTAAAHVSVDTIRRSQSLEDGVELEDGALVHILQQNGCAESGSVLTSRSPDFSLRGGAYGERSTSIAAAASGDHEEVIHNPSSASCVATGAVTEINTKELELQLTEKSAGDDDDGMLHNLSELHHIGEGKTNVLVWDDIGDDDGGDNGFASALDPSSSHRRQMQKNHHTTLNCPSAVPSGKSSTAASTNPCDYAMDGTLMGIDASEEEVGKAIQKQMLCHGSTAVIEEQASLPETSSHCSSTTLVAPHASSEATFPVHVGDSIPIRNAAGYFIPHPHNSDGSSDGTTTASLECKAQTGISGDRKHMYASDMRRLTAVMPALIVGFGTMGFFCGGGLQVVGAGALASMFYHNILWAQNRESLQRELRSIVDRRRLLDFLERWNVIVKIEELP